MRLRKLGQGQTVQFFGPPEVHSDILWVVNKNPSATLDSYDVLYWVSENTCQQVKKHRPLWISQGASFANKDLKRAKYIPELLTFKNVTSRKTCEILENFKERETSSLYRLYGPQNQNLVDLKHTLDEIGDHPYGVRLKEAMTSLGHDAEGPGHLGIQQERAQDLDIELEMQSQESRQVYTDAEPRKHNMNPEAMLFVQMGTLTARHNREVGNSNIIRAFDSLLLTRASSGQPLPPWGPNLYMTDDFLQSLRDMDGERIDEYCKPVQYVISSTISPKILIVSHEEASWLLPTIRQSDKVRLHLFAPRTTRNGSDLSDLRFYHVSGQEDDNYGWPKEDEIRILNLFAGTLYLRDYDDYVATCNYLGLVTKKLTEDELRSFGISNDGFANRAAREKMGWPVESPFEKSPIPLLKSLLSLRTLGKGFDHTHMGAICNHHILEREDFEKPVMDESLFVPEEDVVTKMDIDEPEDEVDESEEEEERGSGKREIEKEGESAAKRRRIS
jgi:hypothetical protein